MVHGSGDDGSRWFSLDFNVKTEVTGEADHQQLESIEVIFGQYEQIAPDALRLCRRLRSLTLINCNLRIISHLQPVASTLTHLCLSNQSLSVMEGLDLPNLRSLYLQQNRIERIGGLEKCRRLQKLWLFGNRIFRVEGLGYCSDLRELWLQDNEIDSLASDDGSGLSDLVNLQTLCLAQNRIQSIEEFQHLRRLISIHALSFADDHFGTNPLVNHPDYRSYAIATLKHLRTLDGVPVDKTERVQAEDLFLTQALEFNDKIAELTLAYEQELRSINSRKDRGLSNAQMLQQELIQALNDVEKCVTDGRQQIADEHQRQKHLRVKNTRALRDRVEQLRVQFSERVDAQIEQETQAMLAEERQYTIMEQEALAEQNQALTIATLQCMFPTTIAFQHLPEHTADHRFIQTQFRTAAHENSVRLLQMYRFYHQDQANAFEAKAAAASEDLFLYLVANDDEVIALLQSGVGSTANSASEQIEWLFLFSSPVAALRFYKGTPGEILRTPDAHEEAANASVPPDAPMLTSYNLLLCRVRVAQTTELFDPETPCLTSLDAMLALAARARGSAAAFLQLPLDTRTQTGGHVYMAQRHVAQDLVLPQVFILAVQHHEHPESSHSRSRCEPPEEESPTELLSQFHTALQDEVRAHHTRLYHELHPSAGRFRLPCVAVPQQLQSQIDQERRNQQQVVRSLRAIGASERS